MAAGRRDRDGPALPALGAAEAFLAAVFAFAGTAFLAGVGASAGRAFAGAFLVTSLGAWICPPLREPLWSESQLAWPETSTTIFIVPIFPPPSIRSELIA